MSDRRGTVAFWGGGLLMVVLVAVLLAGGTNEEPLDPRSVAPDGAKALVDLLESFGTDVELGESLPAERHRAAVLLDDSYGVTDRERLERWVRDGGILLVADPFSSLTPRVRGDAAGPPGCGEIALAGVSSLSGARSTFVPPDDGVSCFGGTVVVDPLGDGVIVGVGGPEPFLNDAIDDADNAVLAVAVLAPEPGSSVVFLEPALPVGVGGESLVDLISDPVWLLLIQAGVGFALFAWWRARRLGMPVPEPVEVRIEGSELAAARGRLLEGLRLPAAAAAEVRADTTRRLARRMGLPADAAIAVISERAAAAAGVDPSEAMALLGDRTVSTDPELLALSRGLADLRRAVLTPASSRTDLPTPPDPPGSAASGAST